ncbi:phenylalanine--tRNA ligase subunit beta [Parasulfuritortus cantonensis]|uniref:Phenylalanine--tRNA ligase beta subunit n=1 Tax=Parasulfuritortus cantonensis TaxID=2528202 RepID=A0A4R1BA73_9PROT|nr:phenylalanine--tRNA ligase subunit beta [Parasulfuritortus cantonensis]TCJ13845.1 phenylalanine--tRNA ligase subunit beta [Parasulfuritortus cantonensis]
MQFSEAWLRSLVNPKLDTGQLCHLMTMAGLEVEDAVAVAPAFSHVVVAEILSADKHPNADRLQVCTVDAGGDQPLQVVCGAPNARAGLKTVCATVGAELPNDFKIKQAKVRGVESFGMLCSAKELALSDAAEGIMELPADAPVGQPLRQYLDLDDQLITIKMTPNRGDCLSIRGIAREVAAISGSAVHPVDCSPVAVDAEAAVPAVAVAIEAPAGCPIYCGRLVRGIDPAAKTPDWMVRRLQRGGVRAIHPVVDVTNYVMLELGEPMHAFDIAKVAGGIRVRAAQPGEKLALLNEQTVEIKEGTLVIADDRAALALAGIMGGAASAVSDTTVDIFLEAAHFTPDALAGRARAYGLATDSSHRFERGVDPALPALAIERATRLIVDICGGQAGPVTVAGGEPAQAPSIEFRPARARRLLGMDVTEAEMCATFVRLGLDLEAEGHDWQVSVPSYRFDLATEVDLIEEIARIKGYDNLPAVLPVAVAGMPAQPEGQRGRVEIRQRLMDLGYQEVITYSFIDAKQQAMVAPGEAQIELVNPIASQMGVMRGSLMPGLLATLRHNLNHGQDRIRLFELGRCFLGTGADAQPLRLGGLAYGPAHPEQWGEAARAVDFFDVKGDLEVILNPAAGEFAKGEHPALHPGQSARVALDGRPAGWLGALHPRLVQQLNLSRAPILFEFDWDILAARPLPNYRTVSRFPAVRRDIAVVVDAGLAVGAILAAVQTALPALVTEIALFDVYQGKGVPDGKKSLAFKMLLQDTEKTLTDVEIEKTVSEVLAYLAERFGATLRS